MDIHDPELRDRAVAAARGDAPFDLLIEGAEVADVALGELRRADIGIVGPLIASVHESGARSDAGDRIDAGGRIAAPGLIDSHMHIESSMVTPATYAAAVIPRGVTTVVWDPHELANVAGLAGINYAVARAAASPLRILPLAPSCVPSAPGYERAGAEFGPEEIEILLARPEIAGLAEVMDMGGVVGRNPRMRGIVQAGLQSGKPVCGHARGLAGAELHAYAAAGVASDHELTSGDDLIAKLRAGLTIEVRGSHPHLLPEFARALAGLPQFPPTVTLCTDDVFPDDLLENGGLDAVLRALVRCGLPPLRVLQAATLNGALRLGRPDLGLVAPGRRADLALFRDLTEFEAVHVLCNGQFPPLDSTASGAILRAAEPMRRLAPADFDVAARGPAARVATIDEPRFTRWGESRMDVRAGALAPPADVLRMTVVHRHGCTPAEPRTGFLTGWGTWKGAFATTVSHDSHNLTVFGCNPTDMAVAANALREAGGGMAVAAEGTIRACLPLPVAGLVSEAPLDQVAEGFAAVRAAMDGVADWVPPNRIFKALVGASLACNPGPRLTDRGIADPLAGRLLPSPVIEDGLPE